MRVTRGGEDQRRKSEARTTSIVIPIAEVNFDGRPVEEREGVFAPRSFIARVPSEPRNESRE